jgi:DNA invertase Pin-like site-specific DNA recombinase
VALVTALGAATAHLDRVVRDWRDAHATEQRHRRAVREAARTALAAGMPETEAAYRAGVSRMTVRKWAGKGQRKPDVELRKD